MGSGDMAIVWRRWIFSLIPDEHRLDTLLFINFCIVTIIAYILGRKVK